MEFCSINGVKKKCTGKVAVELEGDEAPWVLSGEQISGKQSDWYDR